MTARLHSWLRNEKAFPCYFGSALGLDGVDALLDGLERYLPAPQYGADFGARVFKIARDAQGNRLSYLKITGGALSVREQLSGSEDGGWQEKVSGIRIYSGEKFRTAERVESGMVCAVTGLTHTRPGMGLARKPVRCRRFWNPFSGTACACRKGVMRMSCCAICASSRRRTRSFAWCGTND